MKYSLAEFLKANLHAKFQLETVMEITVLKGLRCLGILSFCGYKFKPLKAEGVWAHLFRFA
jgi:hypothetical protein